MKDRLQLRFDTHLYDGVSEIKEALAAEKENNLVNWALKGEPIVFFYKNSGETNVNAVLAIGLDGDGNGVTGKATNGYFLIDANTLRNDIDEVSGNTEGSISAITGLTNIIDNIISGLGFEEDGDVNFHKHHAAGVVDLGDMYPDPENVFDLLEEMAKDVKGNLNSGLRLEYEDGLISIYNGNDIDPISSIDASEFVADGFLSSVTIVTEETQEAKDPEGLSEPDPYGRNPDGTPIEGMFPYIMFVWNSDAHMSISRVGLHKIMNPYKAGDGLNLDDDTFSIRIDEANSESFLSVERGGLKVTGIQSAIDAARDAAKTKVEKETSASHITITHRDGADGSVTYVIGETDIASKSGLDAEITTRTELTTNLSSRVDENGRKIDAVSSNTVTLFDRVSGLSDSLQSEIQARSNADSALSSRVSALETGLTVSSSALTFEIARSTAKDTEIEGSISEINGNIDSLGARIGTLEDHEISGVDSSDKMLSIANGLIASTFRVVYDSVAKRIEFFGKNDSSLGYVNTSDFVIDGMIDTVSVVQVEGENYLRFVFNTDAGKQNIDINLTDLVTEYTVDEDSRPYLYISGFTIGVKVNTTDGSGLATERDIHDITDIVGSGFNTASEQHTLTQKIRHIEEVLDEMPSAAELEDAVEDIQRIKDVISVQLKTKVVNPSADLNLSFYGIPASDYILVGTSVQPSIVVSYNDGKYVSANGSETLAECEVNANSTKTLKLNGEDIGTVGIGDNSPVITILDGEYSAEATVNYHEGTATPTDAFGEPNESIRIPAGSVECETEKVIKAFRPVYYGPFDPETYPTINATTLNTMITNGEFIPLSKYGWDEKEYITVPGGSKGFAVIVPVDGDRFVGGEIRAILDDKDHGFNIIDQFGTFNLPNVRTYTGDAVGFPYRAYVYQPATEMEESYFKVIY